MKWLHLSICALVVTGAIFFAGVHDDNGAKETPKGDAGETRQRQESMQASSGVKSANAGSQVRAEGRTPEAPADQVWYRALHAPEIEKNAGHGHD